MDATLFIVAVAGGVATLAQTSGDHGPFLLFVDIVVGSAACLAL